MSETYRGPDSSPNCANCPCAVNGAPTRPIRGAGSLKSLAIVGEGPSTEDLSQGWPLVGASGKLLQQALNASNIDRHSIWVTNAILCQRPNNERQLEEAVTCCRPRLQHELSLVSPTAIIGLGATAAKALELPIQAIKQTRGTVQHYLVANANVPVVSTVHPGMILAGGGAGSVGAGKNKMNVDAQYVFLEADIRKAYKLATESTPLWSDDIEVITDNKDASLASIFELVDQAKLLSIDLEWDKNDKITWVGIATPKRAVSIFWPGADDLCRTLVKRAGESLTPKLFHNLQADVPKWEEQIGPLNGQFEDTMLMHHASFPGAAHDLQNVASQFLLVPPWKADRKNEEKEAAKAVKKEAKSIAKSARQAAHEQRNADSASAAKERKRQRKAAHDARNTTAHYLKLLGD